MSTIRVKVITYTDNGNDIKNVLRKIEEVKPNVFVSTNTKYPELIVYAKLKDIYFEVGRIKNIDNVNTEIFKNDESVRKFILSQENPRYPLLEALKLTKDPEFQKMYDRKKAYLNGYGHKMRY